MNRSNRSWHSSAPRSNGSRDPVTHRLVGLTLLAFFAILALAGAATTSPDDPRIEMLGLRLVGDPERASVLGERLRRNRPERAGSLGIDLALGATYEQQERDHDAFDAWQRAISSGKPLFRRFAVVRLADLHLRVGRPDSAARFARRGLGESPDWSSELLASLIGAVERNRDCDALSVESSWRLDSAERRRLELASAACGFKHSPTDSIRNLASLLGDDITDLVASSAIELLWPHRDGLDTRSKQALAEAAHHHRLFDKSTLLWRELLAAREDRQERYKLARGHFWLGEYAQAAEEFARAAKSAADANETAQAWYQRGRSLELAADNAAALVAFRRAHDASPTASWGTVALFSALRLETLAGRDEEAARLYRLLTSSTRGRAMADRAALFLASSDIVRGRRDRARGWLSRSTAPEFSYWKGRLAELEGRNEDAVVHYLALAEDLDHPLADWAHQRLRGDLAEHAEELGRELARSPRVADLKQAVLLFDGRARDEAAARLWQLAAKAVGDLWHLSPAHVQTWPLWTGARSDGDALLRLGIVTSDAEVRAWFPLDNPALAIAGIDLLYLADRHRSGLRATEILAKKLEPRLRPAAGLLPGWLERRLYPRPFLTHIEDRASAFDLDAELLLALIRQESRFDPNAVSAVSARGLTQFVPSTAQEAATLAAISDLTPQMLHQPELAIALGAAHLSQLQSELNSLPAVLAAYNAGQPQALLWAEYCFSTEPVEYYTKVGFAQTRDYIAKVIGNRNRYLALYGEATDALPAPPGDGVMSDR